MEKENERRRIGNRIAQLRKEKGITQEQLAEMTGLRQPNIARIELGKYSIGFDILQTIAEALGCDVDLIEK